MASKNEATVMKDLDRSVATAEMKRKTLASQYNSEEKRSVSISPLYKPYFGKVMTVTINGISCAVPVDGKNYSIPKTFAEEVEARKYKQDRLIEKKKGMSDIQNNFESSPGELTLF